MAASLENLLALAAEAARKASGLLKQIRDKGLTVIANQERDIKLAADQASEKVILKVLQDNSSFPILTEEQGQVAGGEGDTDFCWIVDPLDGSLNYFQGIPLCCVSIGLWRKQEPLLGVVYDFNREELFTGIVGQGAWMNGSAIHTSATAEPRKAIVCTGFPVSTDFSTEALFKFVQQVRCYKKVRLLGSAALSLAYVAAGRADCYYERDIKIWDVAGGSALVKAAGGKIVQTASSAPNAVTVYAGGPSLTEPGFG